MAGLKWEKTRTPGVYKRPSARKPNESIYRVVFRDRTGHQVTRNFKRLADAESFKKSVDVNRPEDVAAGRIALRAVYDELVASHEAEGEPYAPSTLTLYEIVWGHIAPLADKPVNRITATEVDRVLKDVEKPAMRDKCRRVLSTTFTYAIDQGYVKATPVHTQRKRTTRAARMRHHAETGRRYRLVTADELARLVDAMPERYKALVELMAYCGLRPGEAVSLRVGKFDPLMRTLRIDTAIGGFTKTGQVRTLVLPAVVAEILTDHLARFSDPSNADAMMFTKEDGSGFTTKPSYAAWARHVFGRAGQRADVDHGLSPNDLRHYAVKFAIGQGATVFAVQRMLGHAKPSITLDIYGSEWETSAETLAENLDEPIRQARAARPTEAKVVRL
jgi:integrase